MGESLCFPFIITTPLISTNPPQLLTRNLLAAILLAAITKQS
jgi:hypothetical protein